MNEVLNSCPSCGSHFIKKNKCEDCGKSLKEGLSLSHTNFSKSAGIHQSEANYFKSGKNKMEIFTYKKRKIFDEYENKICSTKRTTHWKGKIIQNFSLGKLTLILNSPQIIIMEDASENKIGHFQMIEKNLFSFEHPTGSYKMDKIGTLPFKVFDPFGDEILILEVISDHALQGNSRLNSFLEPIFKITSTGKVDPHLVIMISLFYLSFYSFMNFVKPTNEVNFFFTVKRGMGTGLKFINRDGTIYGRIDGIRKFYWIMSFLLIPLGIGIILLGFLFYKIVTSEKRLVAPNGQVLGTVKHNFSSTKYQLEIPSKNLIATLSFEKHTFYNSLQGNYLTGTLSSSLRNYILKMGTIVEDMHGNNQLILYGFNDNFIIMKNEKFDSILSCLISGIAINKFLIPNDSGGGG